MGTYPQQFDGPHLVGQFLVFVLLLGVANLFLRRAIGLEKRNQWIEVKKRYEERDKLLNVFIFLFMVFGMAYLQPGTRVHMDGLRKQVTIGIMSFTTGLAISGLRTLENYRTLYTAFPDRKRDIRLVCRYEIVIHVLFAICFLFYVGRR